MSIQLLSIEDVKSIGIMGAGGTMGSTWALNSILHGFQVFAYEPDSSRMNAATQFMKTTLDNMKANEKLEQSPDAVMELLKVVDETGIIQSGAPIILEAIPENLQLKLDFFRELGSKLPESTVPWTNTSCLDVEKLAIAFGRPELLVGAHGMNPVHLTKGVEVVRTTIVDPAVYDWTKRVIEKMGKVPFPAVNVPGFIVNRVFVAFALHLVANLFRDEFDVGTADTALKFSLGHPQGIFKLLDYIGHDTMVNVARELEAATGDIRYQAPEKYLAMVTQGHLGKKSGHGFYDWTDPRNPIPIPMEELALPVAKPQE